MKKLFLLFVFLPILSFSQETNERNQKGIRDSMVIREAVKPAYFLDGKEVDSDILTNLNPNDIKSITIIKNDPKYPQGKIDIYLK